jgi:tetratricopeptide (TPR) repeat protein
MWNKIQFLTTMNKTVYVLLLTVLTISTFAQSNVELIDVFKKTYELEYQGEYKKAAEALKNVYNADSYEINLRLGWLDYEAGLFNESEVYYRKAIDLMPYSEEAKFGLIYPLSALGKWNEAENVYKKILEISPNNTTANYRLGLIYYGRNDFTNAYKYFEKVVNLYPFGYDGLLMFAWTNLKIGKMREAKILFNKVLLYSPDDASAKEGLSYIK